MSIHVPLSNREYANETQRLSYNNRIRPYEDDNLEPKKAIFFYSFFTIVFYILLIPFINFFAYPIVGFCSIFIKREINIDYLALLSTSLWTQILLLNVLLKVFKIKNIFRSLKNDFCLSEFKLYVKYFLIGLIAIITFICCYIYIPAFNNFMSSSYELNRLIEIINYGHLTSYIMAIIVIIIVPIIETYFFRQIMFDIFLNNTFLKILFITFISTLLKLLPFCCALLTINSTFITSFRLVNCILIVFIPTLISNLIYNKCNYNMIPSLMLHMINNLAFVILIMMNIL